MLSQYNMILSQYYDYKNKDYKGTTANRNKLYGIECYHIYYDCNYEWRCILSQIMLTHHNNTTSIVEVTKLR